MAIKVRKLLEGSARLFGAVASGETMTAEEQADGLYILNEMLDSWSTDNLSIPSITRESFALIPGQQVYTIGPTGDFVTSRPAEIVAMSVQLLSANPSIEIPMEMLNQQQWRDIVAKDLSSTYPDRFYVEGTSPLERFNVWPKPLVANNLFIDSLKPLTQFATVNDDINVPPGYLMAMRYNLALRWAPEFGKSVSPEVLGFAGDSLEKIKSKNIKESLMEIDSALAGGGRFNILKGE